MKFLPCLLSLLTLAVFAAARPAEVDSRDIIDDLLDILFPDDEPPVAEGFVRCPVDVLGPVDSETCPGNPKCTPVNTYYYGDTMDFKCYLAGYAETGVAPRAWVRVQTPDNKPWSYFPRDDLDQNCALEITAVCPEGEDLDE